MNEQRYIMIKIIKRRQAITVIEIIWIVTVKIVFFKTKRMLDSPIFLRTLN